MNLKERELSYRRAAVENASSVGLIIILYDLLIEDLRNAVSAIEKRDIEGRANAIKHCFLVLQQLEGSLDKENGKEASEFLAKFYAVMRCRILEAHMKVSAEILNQQVTRVLDLRQTWQRLDPGNPTPAITAVPGAPQAVSAAGDGETENANWTA